MHVHSLFESALCPSAAACPACRSAAGALYRPKNTDDDEAGEEALRTEKFKPDKGFKGADVSAGPRSAPVAFERQPAEEADPFGLDQFLSEVKADKGRGKGGGMSCEGLAASVARSVFVGLAGSAPMGAVCRICLHECCFAEAGHVQHGFCKRGGA